MENVTVNGVTFLTSHPKSYFNRKRSKRLHKKLHTGEHLTVLVRIVITCDPVDDGGDLMDDLIDLSYENREDRDVLNGKYCLTVAGADTSQGHETVESIWEFKVPSRSVLVARMEELTERIQELFDIGDVVTMNHEDDHMENHTIGIVSRYEYILL